MNFPLRRGIQGNLEMKEKIVTPLRMMSHALLTSALLMAGAAWAAGPQKGGVPGFLDPKTGAFTAYVAPTQHAQTLGVEAATYTGTLVMKFNITLKSGIPTDAVINCTQNAIVSDPSGTYSETKTYKATRTGNTATCSVSIPYSWVLSSGDQQISQTYSVLVYGTPGSSLVLREASAYGTYIDMPANGGTSTRTVNVTL
jgi:hypothetical protein